MLYCVFNNKNIIGRFKREDKAIKYMMDCQFNGMNKVKIKSMTKEEYLTYMKKMLDIPLN